MIDYFLLLATFTGLLFWCLVLNLVVLGLYVHTVVMLVQLRGTYIALDLTPRIFLMAWFTQVEVWERAVSVSRSFELWGNTLIIGHVEMDFTNWLPRIRIGETCED